MKNFKLFSSFVIISYCFIILCTGCNPCKETNCFNGGVCIEGDCNCPEGYSGLQCENYDECYDVDCLNGGFCINGICDCPPGFTGPHCEDEIDPTSMTITGITVNDWPGVGNDWDAAGYPDILVTINSGTEANFYDYQTGTIWEVHSGDEVSFSVSKKITSLYSDWSVAIWDDDSSQPQIFSAEPMGGYYFYPSNYFNDFPSTIVLYNSASSPNLKLTLTVSWAFN